MRESQLGVVCRALLLNTPSPDVSSTPKLRSDLLEAAFRGNPHTPLLDQADNSLVSASIEGTKKYPAAVGTMKSFASCSALRAFPAG